MTSAWPGCGTPMIGSSIRASLEGRMDDQARVRCPTWRSIVSVPVLCATGDTCPQGFGAAAGHPPTTRVLRNRDGFTGTPRRGDRIARRNRRCSIKGAAVSKPLSRKASAHSPLLFRCPNCGLTLRPRARWLAIEHCPLFMARARLPVALFSLALPAGEWHPDGSAPTVEQKGPTATTKGGIAS